MSSSRHRQGRNLGALVALGVGVLCACTVDTSDIKWVPDKLLDGEGAESGDGGSANIGGVANVGGMANVGGLGKAGSPATAGNGSGGAGTGGSKQMGGMPGGGMDAGGTPGGGAPNEVCTGAQADPNQPALDDLEDGDGGLPMRAGRRGGWYVINDSTGNQTPPANMPVMPDEPGFSSNYAMHTAGGGFVEWGATLGLVLLSQASPRPPCPYDLSRHTGLRFALRGMVSDGTVWVQFPTVQTHQPAQGGNCMLGGDCGDHFGIALPVMANWTSVSVSFDELAQAGWGAPFNLDLRQVINIEFHVGANTTFDFWVDDLTFY